MPHYQRVPPAQPELEPKSPGSNALSYPSQTIQFQRPVGAVESRQTNRVGSFPARSNQLPPTLQSNMERMGGVSLSDVVVKRNSPEPAKLHAAAYAQGNKIHLGTGSERHLAHEAWHVVQQKQGRVPVTKQFAGKAFNNDQRLEQEADVMGARAASISHQQSSPRHTPLQHKIATQPIQRVHLNELQIRHPNTGTIERWNRTSDDGKYYHPATHFWYHAEEINVRTPGEMGTFYNDLGEQVDRYAYEPTTFARGMGVNPNKDYVYRGLTYELDHKHRPVRVRGTIRDNAPETGRSSTVQLDSWKLTEGVHRSLISPAKRFNGGHVIAHHLGGSPGSQNMVPMQDQYNQHGSYKTFENALDDRLTNNGHALNIDLAIAYPMNDSLLANLGDLVINDPSRVYNDIDGNPIAKKVVIRAFERVPSSITINSLQTIGGAPVAPVNNPNSPRTPLRGNLKSDYDYHNILRPHFTVTKTSGGERQTKTLYPYERKYGLMKDHNISKRSDYIEDLTALYRDRPEPGITAFKPAINGGVAGGVEAFIWMDPMGIYNQFGGSDTNSTVNPLGVNWRYFQNALKVIRDSSEYAQYQKTAYIRGHLLNAQLHGPGTDSRNLVPLTSTANHDMSFNFEEPVKRLPALTDPSGGVIWDVTSNGQVTRGAYQQVDARGNNSENLWLQENRIPKELICKAYEASIVNDVPQKGRLLLSYTVANVHGTDNPHLGETVAGIATKDSRIVAGAQGHDINDYQEKVYAGPQSGYLDGYGLGPKNANTMVYNTDFANGIEQRGYDEGFQFMQRRVLGGGLITFQPQFNTGHANGRQARMNAKGYLMEDAAFFNHDEGARFADGVQRRGRSDGALGRGAQTANDVYVEGFNTGRGIAGRRDGLNLILPARSADQSYVQAHQQGLEEAGRQRALARQIPQSVNAHYVQGYRTAIEPLARNAGRNMNPIAVAHDLYTNFYWEEYDQRGYDDGFALNDAATGTARYMNRFNAGRYDTGSTDTMFEDAPRRPHDTEYMRGWAAGNADDIVMVDLS